MNNTNNQELKILALKEGFRNKVASLVDEYEDRVADLRIEITRQSEIIDRLTEHNKELETRLEPVNAVPSEASLTLVEGEVVEQETSDQQD